MSPTEPARALNIMSATAPAAQTFRVAPHNVEVEQALLGAILVNNDTYDRVADFLKVEDFS